MRVHSPFSSSYLGSLSRNYKLLFDNKSSRECLSPYPLVTHSEPILDFFSQSLERAYFEGSEGEEGLVDHQVHFKVSQLETGVKTACKFEPNCMSSQVRLSKLNFYTKSRADPLYPPSAERLLSTPLVPMQAVGRGGRASHLFSAHTYLSHSLNFRPL
jgi:hypothetical protein